MHPEAHDGFERALASAIRTLPYQRNFGEPITAIRPGMRVLDIGGQDINGTVYDLFPAETDFTVLDLYPQTDDPNIIKADARTWEPDRLFDVVMCTELFEHVNGWERVVSTMHKALDPGGAGVFLATCASKNRPVHGQHGAPTLEPGEWYRNVDPGDLASTLGLYFPRLGVEFRYPPGDAYAWACIHP